MYKSFLFPCWYNLFIVEPKEAGELFEGNRTILKSRQPQGHQMLSSGQGPVKNCQLVV
jgi:hypothetical protein